MVFCVRLCPKDIIRFGLCPVQVTKYKLPGQNEFVELSVVIQQQFRDWRVWEDADADQCWKDINPNHDETDVPSEVRRALDSLALMGKELTWWSEKVLPEVYKSLRQD